MHTLLGQHWSKGIMVTEHPWEAGQGSPMLLDSPACHLAAGTSFHHVILLG